MKKPTAEQLLELASLQIKRIKVIADQEEVKAAIRERNHPFWGLIEKAALSLAPKEGSIPGFKATIAISATPEKKTADCFSDPARHFRKRENLDNISINLLDQQHSQPAGSFMVCVHTFSLYSELVDILTGKIEQSMLPETYADRGLEETKLREQRIRDRGWVTTLPAIEMLIERAEAGENVCLQRDYVNEFFVENTWGGVSVLSLKMVDGKWWSYIFGLGTTPSSATDAPIFLFSKNT